jgi:hypothetical protein
MLALAVLSMGWLLVGAFAGVMEGLAMLAPALLLLLPLLAGRYLGEDALDRLRVARARPPARRLRRRAAAPARNRHVALVPRGGLLLASSLATRPPPALG